VLVTPTPSYILIEFEKYPIRPAGFQDLMPLLEKASQVRVTWEDTRVFHVHSASSVVADQVVEALKTYLGLAQPAPASDPYDRIRTVVPDPASGKWRALDANGKFVMWLTPTGARQLVQQNPAVTIPGLQ
jgi:hypothetical protein